MGFVCTLKVINFFFHLKKAEVFMTTNLVVFQNSGIQMLAQGSMGSIEILSSLCPVRNHLVYLQFRILNHQRLAL